MKIENLKEGMVIMNYKELCCLLEVEPTTSNSKKAQLKELSRFCSSHKEGQKIIIDAIYETPLPPVENKRNDIYGEHIEKLVIDYMSKQELDEYNAIDLKRSELFLALYMINSNYDMGRANINQFSRYMNIPTQIVEDFYNIANTKMKSAVERALKRLQNRCLINYTTRMYVKTTQGIDRPATKEEERIVTETERKALVDLGLYSKQDAFIKKRWKEYQDEVKGRLEEFNLRYSYKVYRINTTEDFRKMLLDETSYNENIWELNAKMCNSMVATSKATHKKRVVEFETTPPTYEDDKCAILPQYERCFKKLVDMTMDDKPPTELEWKDFYGVSNKVYTSEEFIEYILKLELEGFEYW